MSKKNRKPWSVAERLIVAAVVLCLAAACTMVSFYIDEKKEREQANEDFHALESFVYEGDPAQNPVPQEVMSTLPPDAELEEESVEEDEVLLEMIERAEGKTKGADTVTPMPTPPPTAALPSLSASIATQSTQNHTDITPRETASIAPSQPPTPTPAPTPRLPLVGGAVEEKTRYVVDFGGLQEINEDVVGWILGEGTQINYPIVQGEDNEYYLTRLYTRATNRNGAIFMDSGNSEYFTDMVTYVYGHNRRDDTMFASIPKYQDQAYYEEHQTLYLLTPYYDYRLEAFGCIRSSVDEKDSWHTKHFEGKGEFDQFMQTIGAQSLITSSVRPQWGDQVMALCTCTNDDRNERYILFLRMRPIAYEAPEISSVMQASLDSGTSGMVDVPGRGAMQYYAQNDPTWATMRYESRGSGKSRRFGTGGCGPTSMAMVVANLVDAENLWWLSYYSGREEGITFCNCSVNQYFCNHKHPQHTLRMAAEYQNYLPVAIANFATGNNQWNEKSRTSAYGTKPVFMKRVSDAYALTLMVSKEAEDAVSVLRRGGMAAAVTGGKRSPFTGGGHYVTLAAVDDTYVYILDPFLKDDYCKTDKDGILSQIQPGLLRVKLEDWDKLCLYTFYLFEKWEP